MNSIKYSNLKKFFCLVSLMLAITFFITSEGWTQSKPGTKGPIITHSYAVEKGPQGYIWKIYIEAEDPDGDMDRIASVVDEPGYGRYPTDWLILKQQYRRHLIGYLQWNTRSRRGYLPEWTPITLKVSIIDKAGNESKVVIFPFTFETGVWPSLKQPAPFDREDIPRLGYLSIDLFGLDAN